MTDPRQPRQLGVPSDHKIGKGATGLTKDVGKNATENVGKATKGVTDLFKKKKE